MADPPGSNRQAKGRPRKATALQLVFMTYAVICSGAYGLEEIVSTGGPGLAVLVLFALPFLYAAPVALTCAELAVRFPVEGGYYRWVRLAFGDFAGYVCGWLTWLAIFATNASFAVLFGSYLRDLIPNLPPVVPAAAAVGVVWVAVFLNYRGIRLVGTAAIVFTILIFIPFLLLTVMGFAEWRHNPVAPFANPDTPFKTALLNCVLLAMWLYGGFEKMTVAAEEVEDPARAFPMALAISVPLCALSYILPTVAALAAAGDWREWGEAHFVAAAAKLGGPWLRAAMAAGALVSNAGLLTVTSLTQSRLAMVLADDRFFPSAFGRRHPRFGTPVVALVVAGLVLTGLCALSFRQLVEAAALVQSVCYLMIYAAFFKLRRRPADKGVRGFRIPFRSRALTVMVVPSVVLVWVVLQQRLLPGGNLDIRQVYVDVAILSSGPLTYILARHRAT